MKEKMKEKELLYRAAEEYSCFGIIRNDTIHELLGEKPKKKKELLRYLHQNEQLIHKVAVIATRMQ